MTNRNLCNKCLSLQHTTIQYYLMYLLLHFMIHLEWWLEDIHNEILSWKKWNMNIMWPSWDFSIIICWDICLLCQVWGYPYGSDLWRDQDGGNDHTFIQYKISKYMSQSKFCYKCFIIFSKFLSCWLDLIYLFNICNNRWSV